jgi:hypothetical protein
MQVRHLIDRALRIATSERRVTAVILPNDLQDVPYEAPTRSHGTLHSGWAGARRAWCRSKKIYGAQLWS